MSKNKKEQRGKIFSEITEDVIELDNQAYNLIKQPFMCDYGYNIEIGEKYSR